jgi:hypothetical protein
LKSSKKQTRSSQRILDNPCIKIKDSQAVCCGVVTFQTTLPH